MVLDGQEGDPEGVKGLKERYWMRFLKGMVMNCNNHAVWAKWSDLK
jgi:hypothetical protein